MATIRQIVPSQSISDFRPVRQEGGGGFRALADAMDVAYEYMLPKAIAEAEGKGDAVGRELSRQQIGDPSAAVVQSTMGGAPTQMAPADPNAALGADAMAALGKGGQWLKYNNQNAVRNDPLDARLVDAMSFVGDMGITMEVISGGQEGKGTPGARRVGSTRHDHGNAADVDFYKGGRKLDWNNPNDLPVLQDIVRTAKTRGVTGIGAGDDYMGPGRFHVGFGNPGVWGAEGKGANAPAWLREAYDGVPQGSYAGQPTSVSSSSMGGGPAYEPPTVLRDADGKLSSRLFGPTSNPIMAAHDAAAGVAYQSGVFLKAGQDFMAMSEQFALNPEGFQQAADEYVKAMVEQAPEPFRMDVRGKLETEANRRFLGLVDEKHSNIRQRAVNSSTALSEMWADDFASAIATGNPEEIETARTELASVLAARERLPGSTWTPEQSFNYMRKAEEAGQRRIQEAQKEQMTDWKSQLDLVSKAAGKMLTASDESILDNPLVQQMLPEQWRKAASSVIMRETMGELRGMTPAQVATSVAEFASQPIVDEFQVDMVASLQGFEKEHRKAFREDPISAAMTYFPEDRKPRPLPAFDPSNPDAYLTALQERAAFSAGLQENGYTDQKVMLSKQEVTEAKTVLGKAAPAAVRAGMAAAVVSVLGGEASAFFKSAGQDDPILTHGGTLMAHGLDDAATEAFVGAELLAKKEAQKPTSAKSIAEVSPDIATALADFPGVSKAAFETAVAIAAARNPMTTDTKSEEAKAAMEDAIQAALGQSRDVYGRTTGGVQDIGPEGWFSSSTRKVLLPPDVAGEFANAALEAAFRPAATGIFGGYALGTTPVAPDAWLAAGATSAPMLGGEPVRSNLWSDGNVRIKPLGNSGRYRMTYEVNGIEDDVVTADGLPYTFDLRLLIEATQ